MSRGRARHQASRRRVYSTRQRELRERRARAAREERFWIGDAGSAFAAEEGLDLAARDLRGGRRGRAA